MRYEKIPSFLAIAFAISALFVAAFMAASALPVQDLAQYWAAAHLVKTNPYSYQLVSDFEKSAGISSNALPLVIKNPPWAILFILPLGLFGYYVAFAIWAVFSVVVVAGCALAAWNLYNSPPSLAPALLSLFFGPTVVLLMLGQWTVLVLLGVTLFLTMAARKKDWYAGASLLLVLREASRRPPLSTGRDAMDNSVQALGDCCVGNPGVGCLEHRDNRNQSAHLYAIP